MMAENILAIRGHQRGTVFNVIIDAHRNSTGTYHLYVFKKFSILTFMHTILLSWQIFLLGCDGSVFILCVNIFANTDSTSSMAKITC